jgi:hypothetical protein
MTHARLGEAIVLLWRLLRILISAYFFGAQKGERS